MQSAKDPIWWNHINLLTSRLLHAFDDGSLSLFKKEIGTENENYAGPNLSGIGSNYLESELSDVFNKPNHFELRQKLKKILREHVVSILYDDIAFAAHNVFPRIHQINNEKKRECNKESSVLAEVDALTCTSYTFHLVRKSVHRTKTELEKITTQMHKQLLEREQNGSTVSSEKNIETEGKSITSFSLFDILDQNASMLKHRVTVESIEETYLQSRCSIDELLSMIEKVECIEDMCCSQSWPTIRSILYQGLQLDQHESKINGQTNVGIEERREIKRQIRCLGIHWNVFSACAKSCDVEIRKDMFLNVMNAIFQLYRSYNFILPSSDNDEFMLCQNAHEDTHVHLAIQMLTRYVKVLMKMMEPMGKSITLLTSQSDIDSIYIGIFMLITGSCGLDKTADEDTKYMPQLLPTYLIAALDPFSEWFSIWIKQISPLQLNRYLEKTYLLQFLQFKSSPNYNQEHNRNCRDEILESMCIVGMKDFKVQVQPYLQRVIGGEKETIYVKSSVSNDCKMLDKKVDEVDRHMHKKSLVMSTKMLKQNVTVQSLLMINSIISTALSWFPWSLSSCFSDIEKRNKENSNSFHELDQESEYDFSDLNARAVVWSDDEQGKHANLDKILNVLDPFFLIFAGSICGNSCPKKLLKICGQCIETALIKCSLPWKIQIYVFNKFVSVVKEQIVNRKKIKKDLNFGDPKVVSAFQLFIKICKMVSNALIAENLILQRLLMSKSSFESAFFSTLNEIMSISMSLLPDDDQLKNLYYLKSLSIPRRYKIEPNNGKLGSVWNYFISALFEVMSMLCFLLSRITVATNCNICGNEYSSLGLTAEALLRCYFYDPSTCSGTPINEMINGRIDFSSRSFQILGRFIQFLLQSTKYHIGYDSSHKDVTSVMNSYCQNITSSYLSYLLHRKSSFPHDRNTINEELHLISLLRTWCGDENMFQLVARFVYLSASNFFQHLISFLAFSTFIPKRILRERRFTMFQVIHNMVTSVLLSPFLFSAKGDVLLKGSNDDHFSRPLSLSFGCELMRDLILLLSNAGKHHDSNFLEMKLCVDLVLMASYNLDAICYLQKPFVKECIQNVYDICLRANPYQRDNDTTCIKDSLIHIIQCVQSRLNGNFYDHVGCSQDNGPKDDVCGNPMNVCENTENRKKQNKETNVLGDSLMSQNVSASNENQLCHQVRGIASRLRRISSCQRLKVEYVCRAFFSLMDSNIANVDLHFRRPNEAVKELPAVVKLQEKRTGLCKSHGADEDKIKCKKMRVDGDFELHFLFSFLKKYGLFLPSDTQNDEITDGQDLHECNDFLLEYLFCPFRSEDSTLDVKMVDWYAVCIFFICSGNRNRYKDMLKTLAQNPESMIVWEIFQERSTEGRMMLQHLIISLVMEVLQYENSKILIALDECECPLEPFVALWLRQAFVGIIEFEGVLFLHGCILSLGNDYIVYFIVALIDHVKGLIFDFVGNVSLKAKLYNEFAQINVHLKEFDVKYACDFAHSLQERHRERCRQLINSRFAKER